MQGDEGEEEVRDDVGDDRAAVGQLLLGEVVDAERDEAGEQQADQGGGEHDDLDALAALLGPVDVVQVQDQRELVQDQARAHAEQHGRDDPAGTVPVTGHRAEAADDGEDDPGDDVVDVQPARPDVAERALAGPDQPGDQPGDDEGQHEGGEGQQQRKLARLDDVPHPPVPHVRTLSLRGAGKGRARRLGGGRPGPESATGGWRPCGAEEPGRRVKLWGDGRVELWGDGWVEPCGPRPGEALRPRPGEALGGALRARPGGALRAKVPWRPGGNGRGRCGATVRRSPGGDG